ncbi:MAG: hypothetical protein K2K64_00570 [Muribaculaceae bacterium]|nr:hypothetical protein [Muribaculaceae bacterium]
MAKKKSNKQSTPLSPEKFLKEKASNLPLYKCFISKNYKEAGEVIAIISRTRGNGKLCTANFLIDLWCLGIKDVFGNVNLEKERFDDYIKENSEILMECDYPLVHNMIYGAEEFAEEIEINPHPSFRLWKNLLAEDNDDIPLMEMEFGRNGKYLLITEAGSPEAMLIPKLKKKLGDDFDFIISDHPTDIDFDEDEDTWIKEEKDRFHYDYPQYPAEPQLTHPLIGDILLNKDIDKQLSRKDVDKILALPHDEAARDILNLILWQIGKTYPIINENRKFLPDNTLLMDSLLLLAIMESKESFTAAMEILRQTSDFQYAHLDVESSEYLLPAMLATYPDKERLDAIRTFLNEKGHASDSYIFFSEYITGLIEKYPDLKEEAISILKDFVDKLPQRLEEGTWFNQEVPGFYICTILDLNLTNMLPEIEKIFATGKVDSSICGDLDDVKAELSMPHAGTPASRVATRETLMKYLTE